MTENRNMKKAVRAFSKKHDLTYTQAMDFLRDEARKTLKNNPGVVNSFGIVCNSKIDSKKHKEVEATTKASLQFPLDLCTGGSYVVDSESNLIDSDGNPTLHLVEVIKSLEDQVSILHREHFSSAKTHLSISHKAVCSLTGEYKIRLAQLLQRIESSPTIKNFLIISILSPDNDIEKYDSQVIKFCKNDIRPLSNYSTHVDGILAGTSAYGEPVFFKDYDNIIMSVNDKQESSNLREMLSYQIRKSGTKRVLIDLNNKIDFTGPLIFHQEILEFRGEKYQDNGCIVLVDLNNISKTSDEYEDLDFYMNPFFKASVLSPNKVFLWIIGDYKEFLINPVNDFQKSVNEKIVHIVDSSFIHINPADPSDASQMFGTKFLEFDGYGIYKYEDQAIRFNDK
jgi:hypothetical protein